MPLTEMNVLEVVGKLIGPITPRGETNADDRRFENLKQLKSLMIGLIDEVRSVAQFETSQEFSVKRAGDFARKMLNEIKEEI